MAKYLVGVNHARQRRFLHISKRIIIVLAVLALLGLLGILIDSLIQKFRAKPSAPSAPISSSVTPSTEIFTTPYFQFQTNKHWRFISNESSATKFVYRRGTPNLVSGDMTVYINSSPEDVQATRVLPVVLGEDKFVLKASFVSDHCKKNLAKQIQERGGEVVLTLSSVRFLCDVDGNSFTVIVGLENDTPVMNFTRPDGTNANYMIYLRDLRFTPEPKEFEDIMNSFQIR